jgi:hypothetical protein
MTKNDQIKIVKLYESTYMDDPVFDDTDGVELDDDYYDTGSYQNEMTSKWFDEAMELAKDYYVVGNQHFKSQIKSKIEDILYKIKSQGSEDDYTYDFIDQIRGVMQHGHKSQEDDYNAENEYEMRRERQGMERGY